LGDRGHARITLCVSHIVIIISAVLSAWADSAGSQLWAFGALGLGGILLDLGVTGDQTLGRRAVNLLQPEARGRINGLFVCLFFIGGAVGAAVASVAWAHGGWMWVCGAVGSFALLALITDVATQTGTS
jgi:MFS family permease